MGIHGPGLVVVLAVARILSSQVARPAVDGAQNTDGEVVLLGELTRSGIEESIPAWVEEELLAAPDPRASMALGSALEGAEVTVFLGTWCEDSRRELARLWRALDSAGVLDPIGIRYIGVDRELTEPGQRATGRGLERVPTFIVQRQGSELGRIVETSPNGVEIDLVALLRGDVSGVITASDLSADRAVEE